MQVFPAEPEPLDRAGSEVLDEYVGLLRHLLDEGKAALGFEVDGDRFLVGVVDHEVIGVCIGLGAGAEDPAGLAALGIFHLDNLGAEPGERFGAGRTGLELGQV